MRRKPLQRPRVKTMRRCWLNGRNRGRHGNGIRESTAFLWKAWKNKGKGETTTSPLFFSVLFGGQNAQPFSIMSGLFIATHSFVTAIPTRHTASVIRPSRPLNRDQSSGEIKSDFSIYKNYWKRRKVSCICLVISNRRFSKCHAIIRIC